MAAGKPIVGPIDGETARIVRDARCGMCSPAEDPAALAETMRSIAAQPEKLSEYGENARRYYQENFRKEIFISQLIRALQDNAAAN